MKRRWGGYLPLPWAQPGAQDRFGKWRKGKCLSGMARRGDSIPRVPPVLCRGCRLGSGSPSGMLPQ